MLIGIKGSADLYGFCSYLHYTLKGLNAMQCGIQSFQFFTSGFVKRLDVKQNRYLFYDFTESRKIYAAISTEHGYDSTSAGDSIYCGEREHCFICFHFIRWVLEC
jgi:hypothetical protein